MGYSDMRGFTFKPSIRINLYFCLKGLKYFRTKSVLIKNF